MKSYLPPSAENRNDYVNEIYRHQPTSCRNNSCSTTNNCCTQHQLKHCFPIAPLHLGRTWILETMKTFCIKTFHRLRIQGGLQLAVLLEPAGKWNSIQDSAISDLKAIYEQRHSHVYRFPVHYPQAAVSRVEQTIRTTGTAEAVSTPRILRQRWRKTGAHTVHWKYPWTL